MPWISQRGFVAMAYMSMVFYNANAYPRPILRNKQGYWEVVMIDDRVGSQLAQKERRRESSGFVVEAFRRSGSRVLSYGIRKTSQEAKRQIACCFF